MSIQWFPGHMHKARVELQLAIPKVDVVIEILDARIPFSSSNPLLAELTADKPCLKVLAKNDLADEELTAVWQSHFQRTDHTRCNPVTTEDVPGILRLKQTLASMAPQREGKMMKAIVVGIPNVGKSTIINVLAGRKIAKTGNEPAITKQQQNINIGDGITLVDTPGMLWPNVHHLHSGYRLALLGSIKDTAMDYADVGFFGARYLLKQYAPRLTDRYEIEPIPDSELSAIEAIGRRRGCLGKGNVVDIDRASRILITDIRSGALGRLTFETPATIEHEVAQTEREMAEKAERDAKKDAKRKKRFRDRQRAKRKSRGRGDSFS